MNATLTRGLTIAALCVATGAALAQTPAADSAVKKSALAGLVRDQLGHPLKSATLSVDGKGLSAVTNDSGQFFLGGIPAGKTDFTLVRIGYAAVYFQVNLPPDTTLVVNIPMRAVQNIAGVEVTAERVSARLLRDGFYARRRVGAGSFLTPERLDSLSYVMTPSQLLRDVRGVQVRCRAAGRCTVTTTRGGCVAVFVNKSLVYGQMDDALSVGEIYAIEVYERPAIVPVDFSLPRRFANCGVIAVWTKGYAQ